MAEQELLQRADEAQVWYAEKLQDIKSREAQLAAAKESFILEKAAAEMAQAEATRKAAIADSELTQRKVNLDAHEEELAEEEKLAAILRIKDEEIQALLAKRTEELEQKHEEAHQGQAVEHAGKIKEALDAARIAGIAKANLESPSEAARGGVCRQGQRHCCSQGFSTEGH